VLQDGHRCVDVSPPPPHHHLTDTALCDRPKKRPWIVMVAPPVVGRVPAAVDTASAQSVSKSRGTTAKYSTAKHHKTL
jgi:hypothetical protein